jgi:hypothetical protein
MLADTAHGPMIADTLCGPMVVGTLRGPIPTPSADLNFRQSNDGKMKGTVMFTDTPLTAGL